MAGAGYTKRGSAQHREAGGRSDTRPRNEASLPMLRNSERATMKRCEFQWDLTYNRRVKPDREAPALRFGALVHAALAAWYVPGVKRGEHPARAFERLALIDGDFFLSLADEEEQYDKVSALELGVGMLEHYVDEYQTDKDYEVLATEFPFETVVMNPLGDPWFKYVGVLDGVWRHRVNKEIWIPDHKTTGSVQRHDWRHLALDDQAGGYYTFGVQALKAAGMIPKNTVINGMLYNLLRKKLPDERPSTIIDGKRRYLNKDGSVSKKQPVPYFNRVPIYRDEYDGQMVRHRAGIDMIRMAMLREKPDMISKTPGSMTCPLCPMLDACELHETGGDWEAFLQETTIQWEPYAEHEVYLGR